MRSILFMIAILLMPLILGGCAPKPKPIEVKPDLKFCDAYSLRLFTKKQIEWRTRHDPENFRKDLTNNKDHDDECGPQDEESPAD